MHVKFKVSQNIIITNKSNQVLILKHSGSGKWLLPGGRLEKNEGWKEGLEREIFEETGLKKVAITGILDVDSWTDDEVYHYGVTFVGQVEDQASIILSDEHNEYAYINQSGIANIEFWHENIAKRIWIFFDNQ